MKELWKLYSKKEPEMSGKYENLFVMGLDMIIASLHSKKLEYKFNRNNLPETTFNLFHAPLK